MEDDGDAGGGGVDVDPGERVDHVDEAAGEVEGLGGGKVCAGAGGIDVAADGGGGGDGGEGGEDGGVADVSDVEDVCGGVGGQGGEELGAE